MIYDVVLTSNQNGVTAQIKTWPEIFAVAETKEDALKRVRRKLKEYLTTKVEVARIEVDTPIDYGHPLIDNYGIFRDDPTFEEYVTELKVIRAEANAV